MAHKKTFFTKKHSVSPFAASETAENPFSSLEKDIAAFYPEPPSTQAPQLKHLLDVVFVPHFLRKVQDAPANEALDLEPLCQFLIRFQLDFERTPLALSLYQAMLTLFNHKTALFLIDHWDQQHCEKMGWPEPHRDVVLFAKERNVLLLRYMAPLTEKEPGRFAEFLKHWMETEHQDRLLHFLDFCVGSTRPTFEHYLLFSHPALARVVTNKAFVRSLFEEVEPSLKKLSSPTWEAESRKALGI